EYGPFPGVDKVNGVTYDGQNVWFASGDKLNAMDPASGKTVRAIDVAAHAGTAFDGKHLFQIAENRIQKIDPKSGRVLGTIPATETQLRLEDKRFHVVAAAFACESRVPPAFTICRISDITARQASESSPWRDIAIAIWRETTGFTSFDEPKRHSLATAAMAYA